MKFKKLSIILSFGILINSAPIDLFASTLSEDTRYETFIDNDITINDILEEDKVDVKIEGNTLVNLWSLDNVYLHDGMTTSNGYVNVTTNGSTWFTPSIKNIDLLKPNTTYTVITEIIDSTFSSDKLLSVNIQRNDESCSDGNRRVSLANGIYTIVLTTKDDLSKATVGIRTQFEPDKTGLGSCKFRMIILEGDYTNKQIPKYFEGIQSSFENQLVTQEMITNKEESIENLGKYKIEYKTTGKNKIIPFTKMYLLHTEGVSISENKIEGTPENKGLRIMQKFYLSKDMTYCLSTKRRMGSNARIRLMYNDGTTIALANLDGKFTPPNNGYYWIRFDNNANTSELFTIECPQLEESSTKTDYEPYKELIKTFYLNSPLLEGDTIEYINNQVIHVHRSGRVVLDGSSDEKWGLNVITPNQTNTRSYYTGILNQYTLNAKETPKILCDAFKTVSSYEYDYGNGGSMATQGTTSMFSLMVRHTSDSINNFEKWLSENPVTVVYKLTNPIYEPIKTDLSINLFEGTTHISNNSNIPATMEVTVDRALNRAVYFTELAKENPTVNSLSIARYWTNLLRDSLKKEYLQEEINNILNLNEMTLEKKKVTANLDLYIKSENVLIMSLNTNCITFDDFSGVEDITKENAVQISISSSLPYTLNAYLPTEIQSSGKSNLIDKAILNIKENSETTYQAFRGINEKMILKDNNPANNYLSHGIDIKLKGNIAHEKDVYKTTIKFEAQQK